MLAQTSSDGILPVLIDDGKVGGGGIEVGIFECSLYLVVSKSCEHLFFQSLRASEHSIKDHRGAKPTKKSFQKWFLFFHGQSAL